MPSTNTLISTVRTQAVLQHARRRRRRTGASARGPEPVRPTLRRRISPSSSRPATICTTAQHRPRLRASRSARPACRPPPGRTRCPGSAPRCSAPARLAPLVGHDVADPGDRHGNDRGGARPGEEAHQRQRPERRHGGRDHGGNAGPERAQHDHVEPAARVAERPDQPPGTRRRPAQRPSPCDAAVPTVTPSSLAICGSSGSHTRRLAALANEASASRAMARVGVSLSAVFTACSSEDEAIGHG